MKRIYNSLKYHLWCWYFFLCHLFALKKSSVIVMFHHVRDDDAPEVIDSCKCTINEFKAFIDYVTQHKKVVSLQELLSIDNKSFKDKVVITFDDVPDNFFTNAYPLLKKANLPFVLYIASNLIGQKGYLSRGQLQILANDELCTIGGHTRNHVFLSDPKIDLNEEIIQCKYDIEKIIGKEVKHFAYPYGTPVAVNMNVVRFTRKSRSYQSAVSTIPSFVNKNSLHSLFYLPRMHHKYFMKKSNN